MARTDLTSFEEIAVSFPCRQCGAGYEEWCKSINGAWARDLHQARYEPVQKAFQMGWEACATTGGKRSTVDRDYSWS